ncbi:MAG: hypothetical protein WCR48_05455, partial [Bacteroidales bacterium]
RHIGVADSTGFRGVGQPALLAGARYRSVKSDVAIYVCPADVFLSKGQVNFKEKVAQRTE